MIKTDSLAEALQRRRSKRRFLNKALNHDLIQQIAWAAQGGTGSEGRRTTPSANGLQPLELYIATGPMLDYTSGVWAFDKTRNILSRLKDGDVRSALATAALGDQDWISRSACIMTFFANIAQFSKAFDEQPPAGKRGERYAYIEAGGAAQNAMLQATHLGIGSVLVAGFDDQKTASAYSVREDSSPLLHVCFGYSE